MCCLCKTNPDVELLLINEFKIEKSYGDITLLFGLIVYLKLTLYGLSTLYTLYVCFRL